MRDEDRMNAEVVRLQAAEIAALRAGDAGGAAAYRAEVRRLQEAIEARRQDGRTFGVIVLVALALTFGCVTCLGGVR